MQRSLTIQISSRTIVLAIALCLAVYLIALMPDIVFLALVSLILTAALSPAVEWIIRRARAPRPLAVLLVFLLLLSGFALLGLIVVPTLLAQAQTLVGNLPGYVSKVQLSYAFTRNIQPHLAWLPDINAIARTLQTRLSGWLETSLGWLGKVFGVFFTIFVILISTFYMLLDAKRLKAGALQLIPPDHRPLLEAQLDPIASRLGGYVSGVLLSITFLVVYLAVALTLAGEPLALVLAILAGVCEIIPTLGSILGAIPAILVALTVSWQTALVVLAIFLGGNVIQGNLVAPLLYSRSVDVPPIMILFALLIGGTLMGIPGAIIAVPLMAVIQVLVQNLYIEPMALNHQNQARHGLLQPTPGPDNLSIPPEPEQDL
jgi:predicted PurR-regulated permease PerM